MKRSPVVVGTMITLTDQADFRNPDPDGPKLVSQLFVPESGELLSLDRVIDETHVVVSCAEQDGHGSRK